MKTTSTFFYIKEKSYLLLDSKTAACTYYSPYQSDLFYLLTFSVPLYLLLFVLCQLVQQLLQY